MQRGLPFRLLGLGLPALVLIAACGSSSDERGSPRSPKRASCTPQPLEQRAARVVIAGMPEVTDPSDPLVGELAELGVGGIFITDSNVESLAQTAGLVRTFRGLVPHEVVVTTDEESGRVSTFASVLGQGPSPRRMATQSTPTEVREEARRLGGELAAMDIDVDLAPVLDLDDGPWNGTIGDRSFSSDPDVAARFALSYAQGLADARVGAVAKHFPGQGRARGDTHVRAATVDATLDDLEGSDLLPFAEMIRAGIPVVMLTHTSYSALDPGLPASLSARAYELLRDMGFTGVAMTDAVGMGAVNTKWDYEAAAVRAIGAGADALLVTDGNQASRMRNALIAAVVMKELDEARLDEAVSRVVALAGGDPMTVTCRSAELPTLTSAAVPPG